MACIWTFEQMPGDTTEFLINEYKEYNELTKLEEFRFYDRLNHHWFEVKDGNMTVGYDLSKDKVIYLYSGKLDGSHGDITEEYLAIKHENWPNQDKHTVTGLAHGDMRRIVATLMFRAKSLWDDTVVLTCDHDEEVTTRNGKQVGIGYKSPDCELVTLANYPLQCRIVVDGISYLLDPRWGTSFVISRILDETTIPHQHEPVETLRLPSGHSVLKFIQDVDDEQTTS